MNIVSKSKGSFISATDQFCGAGGSTTGAKKAGVEVKMAMNHWNLAIETHNTNHPETDHDCADISGSDPRRYPSTNILITSPECTNHSLAKGQKRKYQNQLKLFGKIEVKPEEERSRATMWDVPRFAEYHKYDVIVVENVVDARLWTLWDAWLKAMHDLGYDHRSIYLNSMFFHPCPQSRDRMYIVFWKRGNKAPDLEYRPTGHCSKCSKDVETFQSFKKREKRYGKYGKQYVYRCSQCNDDIMPYYYAAFNAIDWSIPGTRIGDREKPLAEKTMNRIKYGLEKFGNTSLLFGNYTPGWAKSLEKPAGTVTTSDHHSVLIPMILNSAYNTNPKSALGHAPTLTTNQSIGILQPFITSTEHSNLSPEYRTKGILDPFWTQSTTQSNGIVLPFILELNRTGKARAAIDWLSTILTSGSHHGVLIPYVVTNRGQSKSHPGTEALGTISSNINHGIVTPKSLHAFLSYNYNGNQVSSLDRPAGTVSTRDRMSLIISEQPKIEDCYYRMLKPHEIQLAMAFDEQYIVLGNSREKVKQLGNAVTPPAMEWIIKRCVQSLQ